MKRIILTLLAAVVAMACMTSCKSTLPRRFDSFVNSVEKHADSYSPEDWTKANEVYRCLCVESGYRGTEIRTKYFEFKKSNTEEAGDEVQAMNLVNEYKENADSYNKEQKKQMNAAIGRYVKAVAKSGVDEVVSAVNSIAGQIPSIVESAKGILKDLGITDDKEE